jgi:hypothetical protein
MFADPCIYSLYAQLNSPETHTYKTVEQAYVVLWEEGLDSKDTQRL